MASNSPPDYKALYLKAERDRRQAERDRRRAEQGQRHEAELRKHEAELRRHEAELRRHEAELRRHEAELRRQADERMRQTTFGELIRHCHNLFSRHLRAEDPSRSTTGTIPPPTGKCCPLQLLPWEEFHTRQQEVYRSVCNYLEPTGEAAVQSFPSVIVLEGFGQRFSERPLSSEQDLESYERFGVEDHVRDIIAELCKIPAARDEFHLGDGVRFDNHANALSSVEFQVSQASSSRRFRPDQFCIHHVASGTSILLTTVEYKPPHKLSVENLRVGLRPMNFWEEVVRTDSVPTDGPEKLRYNAAWLTGSVLVQEYHVMIQEGLEYSYVTNGLALVLLRVPYENPTTLYYHLCEPNMEVKLEDDQSFLQPTTAISRVLCLCLMSLRSRSRDQEWRNQARGQLPLWVTSFDHTRSQIPEAELRQNPPNSEYTSSEPTTSEYLPSSSPVVPPTAEDRQVRTRSQSGSAPSNPARRDDSSDSDLDSAASGGRKRSFSQVTSSPTVQRTKRQTDSQHVQGGKYQQHDAQFCTQQCLLGLQQSGALDYHCPNMTLHQKGGTGAQHLINSAILVQLVKQQLDENIDRNCTPMGGCGAYGAPFKVTCAAYGYTIVGKGTTTGLWKEVSREAEAYHVLRQAQGSAVPVFLGAINLAKIYFLHGAGEIQHMLLMAWAGETISSIKQNRELSREISRSKKEIRSLGVLHGDLRLDNILWNAELGRALIIDFHRSKLDHRPTKKRIRPHERLSYRTEAPKPRRLHDV